MSGHADGAVWPRHAGAADQTETDHHARGGGIGWIDASGGASGDMLLGALVGAGVPLQVLQDAVDEVVPEPVTLRVALATRGGFAATRVRVEGTSSTTPRTWSSIRPLLSGRALEVFTRLAEAEAQVHRSSVEEVHFHEVGALDAIADVVGVCAGIEHLGIRHLTVSPVAVGSGTVRTAHGMLPVPPPAVAELLRGFPSYAGPGATETCTPTGAALLTVLADAWGTQPPMTVTGIGVGAGSLNPETHANVVRLFLGSGEAAQSIGPLLLESNVDDMDPRLWPPALQALLDAGASDAWLTPILMKKGRPAHTLSVLVTSERADAVRKEIFRQTSTIGLRELRLTGKTALERLTLQVRVADHPIDVKVALLDGEVVNAQPEYEHVLAAARALGRSAKDVLADAIAATRTL